MKLADVISKNTLFNDFTIEQKEVYLTLAEYFEDTIDLSIYLSPKELVEKLGVGNVENCGNFLQFEPVKIYIKAKMAQDLQVAQRKSVQALMEQAQKGNTQAAKQVAEISGVMESGNNGRQIVLHQISRPRKGIIPPIPSTTEDGE